MILELVLRIPRSIGLDYFLIKSGAVAQLGERLNGIQEVDGSIPFSSTNKLKHFLDLGQHRRIVRKPVRIVNRQESVDFRESRLA